MAEDDRDAETTRRLLHEHHLDRLRAVGGRADTLAAIIGTPTEEAEPAGATPPVTDQPAATATATAATEEDELFTRLYTSEQLSALSNEDLQRLANHYGYTQAITENNRPVVISTIIAFQSHRCEAEGLADPNASSPRQRNVVDPRNWSIVAKILSGLGLIVGIVVAALSKGMYDDIHGFGHGLLVVFWFVCVAAFGFYAFGLLGALIFGSPDDE
jgi:hypothetical protein